jgi:beta-glucosidase
MYREEFVKLYVRGQISSFTRPVKELKVYKRVSLNLGQSKIVSLNSTATSLAMYDKDLNLVVELDKFTIMTGNSSSSKDLKETVLHHNLYKIRSLK